MRQIISALYGIGAALGAGLLLRQLPWETYGVVWWSTTVQLIGTLLTFGGLLYAWERSRRFWSRRVWPRIRRWMAKPPTQVIYLDAATSGTGGVGNAYLFRELRRLTPRCRLGSNCR
jgi:hypothetical protein